MSFYQFDFVLIFLITLIDSFNKFNPKYSSFNNSGKKDAHPEKLKNLLLKHWSSCLCHVYFINKSSFVGTTGFIMAWKLKFRSDQYQHVLPVRYVFFSFPETAIHRCLTKQVFLKISQNLQEDTSAGASGLRLKTLFKRDCNTDAPLWILRTF